MDQVAARISAGGMLQSIAFFWTQGFETECPCNPSQPCGSPPRLNAGRRASLKFQTDRDGAPDGTRDSTEPSAAKAEVSCPFKTVVA